MKVILAYVFWYHVSACLKPNCKGHRSNDFLSNSLQFKYFSLYKSLGRISAAHDHYNSTLLIIIMKFGRLEDDMLADIVWEAYHLLNVQIS